MVKEYQESARPSHHVGELPRRTDDQISQLIEAVCGKTIGGHADTHGSNHGLHVVIDWGRNTDRYKVKGWECNKYTLQNDVQGVK